MSTRIVEKRDRLSESPAEAEPEASGPGVLPVEIAEASPPPTQSSPSPSSRRRSHRRHPYSKPPHLALWLKAGAVAVAAVCLGILLFRGSGNKKATAGTPAEVQQSGATMVMFTPAREMTFTEGVSSDGSVKARFYALVSPRIVGTIDDIFVREGDLVEAGKTKLFQIDSEKLVQSVDLAKQNLVISESTLDERHANLAKAQADLSQADKDFARTKSLYEQKVVPLAEYEIDETKVVQLRAELKVKETMVTLAEQNVTLSQISLAMAEKDLRDSVGIAPITGTVSGRFSEPGEIGNPSTPILRIDDTKQLKAVAYLPGQFFPRISVGASAMQVTVLNKDIGEFPVTYKAPAIDAALRTFEIWADVPGDGAYVVPGAQSVITIILKETHGIGVPRDAVQYRDGKYWIFVPEDGAAKMVEVTPGLHTDGWTQLVDPPVNPGDRVVTQGQFLLNDGQAIRERLTM